LSSELNTIERLLAVQISFPVCQWNVLLLGKTAREWLMCLHVQGCARIKWIKQDKKHNPHLGHSLLRDMTWAHFFQVQGLMAHVCCQV
jgi:hypothetical protein